VSDAASEDLHALSARYFDGELSEIDAARALDHLTVCAACQRELGDLIGLEVALGRPGPTIPITAGRSSRKVAAAARARRRWVAPVAIAGALAAAAGIAVVVRGDRSPAGRPALALAPTRGIEARFSAPELATHRPYAVSRGALEREPFSQGALAELERRHATSTLAAAQAASGDLERARATLATAPASAARDSDLAAIELIAGHPEAALEAATRAVGADPHAAAARWNLGLAMHGLGLPLAGAAALDAVVAAGEPGWAAEARSKAAAWRAAMADRGPRAEAWNAAARAMIDRTGPVIDDAAADVRPGLARLYFHDALRSAASPEEARALAPLADALDRQAGNSLARTAVDAVAGADFTLRAPLASSYRELALGRGDGAALLERLDRSRAPVDDLRLGTLALTGSAVARLPELTRLVEATGDPWFTLMLERDRARALFYAGKSDRAEALLRDALARCDGRRWAHRCAHLAIELVTLYGSATRYAETETYAQVAVQMFRASGATELEDQALSILAEAQRGRGRLALAAATFEEVRARVGQRDCATARYAAGGLALIAVYQGPSTLTVAPPAADACGLAPNPLELAGIVDLARMTGRAEDRARATTWIAAARAAPGLTVAAELAEARLATDSDAGAAARIRALLPQLTATDDVTVALRAWAYQTLVEDAGRRGAWTTVIATAAAELAASVPKSCALVVSVDDTRGTAVALDQAGVAHGAVSQVAAPVQWTGGLLVPSALRAVLAGCPRVSVLARSPMHGRADLVDPSLPWAFIGRTAPPAAAVTARHEVIVGDALPPAALALPALAPVRAPMGAEIIRGAAATPDGVLAALARATYAELHVHGQVDLGVADASFLALSPGADDRWALTAAEVRTARLTAAPVIVLAACRAAEGAPFQHLRWSLPDAFLAAGARAVIAPTVDIPDDEAAEFFDALRTRLAAGDEPATALAALRRAYLAQGQPWAAGVILFD